MKICFITAGPIEWGSSRMRAWWVRDALKARGHEVWALPIETVREEAHLMSGCDAYIWQKTVDTKILSKLDGRHYWDVCDPSWWWQPDYCRQVLEHVEGVVCSSRALAEDFRQWSGFENVHTIPDRLDLSHFTKQRQQSAVSPVRLIWFGVAVNRAALYGALANLGRLVANGHSIELTIMDDRPDVPIGLDGITTYHIGWSLTNEAETLSSHDIALLPPYPGPWGRVKSENKMVTAYACGLPVTNGMEYEQLRVLVEDADERKWQGIAGRMTVENEYTVDKSAAAWEALLT